MSGDLSTMQGHGFEDPFILKGWLDIGLARWRHNGLIFFPFLALGLESIHETFLAVHCMEWLAIFHGPLVLLSIAQIPRWERLSR